MKLLASVRETVELERKELERLHKIDVAATALDQMVQDYAREKEQLEAEIAAGRAAWEEESARASASARSRTRILSKQRQREIDDYEYKKALERKKAQDKYDEEMRLTEKKNQERQEALEKGWQQREAALKEREEELARLRKEAEIFPHVCRRRRRPPRYRPDVRRTRKFEQQMLVLKKDAETEKRAGGTAGEGLEETWPAAGGSDRGARKATGRS